MAHAKALLFIDDDEAEVGKMNVLGEHAMGADEDIDLAILDLLDDFLLLLRGAEAGDHLDVHGEGSEAALEGFVMLKGEHRGRGEDGDLLAVIHRFVGGAHGYFRLAVTDVAAEQAVHGLRAFHVALDVFDGGSLVVGGVVLEGVALPDAKLVFFGANDLFDDSEAGVSRQPRQRSKTSAFLSDFRDLAVGDYVVHVEHGIGQYQGLREILQADGSKAEFMVLEYAEGARLYVPLTRLDLVQKYRSADGGHVILNRLGTQQWVKTKARVKRAMQDMADELLKLYAQRKTAQGFQYSSDSQFMHEFEDAFEYNPTDDQTAAVEDISATWKALSPWTACSAATSVTARRK